MEIRWGAIAGAVGAASYIVGDVMMFNGVADPKANPIIARDDVHNNLGAALSQPAWAARVGAVAGVMATPLFMFGMWDIIDGVDKQTNGNLKPTAIAAGAMLLATHFYDAYIHGSVYHLREAYQRADEAITNEASDEHVEHLVAKAKEARGALVAPYVTHVVLTAAGSGVLMYDIARGRSQYPRWAALVVPPLVPVAASVLASQAAKIPAERVRHATRGASLSIGVLASYVAAALVPRRRR